MMTASRAEGLDSHCIVMTYMLYYKGRMVAKLPIDPA